MSVVVKGAALATMMRVMLVAFGDKGSSSWASGWPPVVAGLAIATMVVANLIAIRQENVKRMLAYSSIAHAGYLLIGLVAAWGQGDPNVQAEGRAALLFYILQYTVTQAGAFGALILAGSRGREAVSYEDLAGLGRRHPAAALPFAIFMVSLAGIPPTGGFFGKLYIFRAAIDGGFTWLAVIGLLNSALAAYYYLRVLVYLYMREPAPGAPQAIPMRSGYVTAAMVISAALLPTSVSCPAARSTWRSRPRSRSADRDLTEGDGVPCRRGARRVQGGAARAQGRPVADVRFGVERRPRAAAGRGEGRASAAGEVSAERREPPEDAQSERRDRVHRSDRRRRGHDHREG
jgi:NADH:ubiquinone oxidoreductase subunit 2 (subunit N)